MSKQKIFSLDRDSSAIQSFRDRHKRSKIGLAHGTFDLFHYGHLKYLQRAADQCDVLIVSITSDAFVNKGPGRPVFDEYKRAELLCSIDIVDTVVLVEHPTALQVIDALQPDLYFKGVEYKDAINDPTAMITKEVSRVIQHGGKTVYIDEPTFSSSNLLNNYFPNQPSELREKLAQLRTKDIEKTTLSALDKASKLHVCVLGETIRDIYVHCNALGKTNKDPILAFVPDMDEMHFGGAFAIALHIAQFVEKVTLITQDGLSEESLSNHVDLPENLEVVEIPINFHSRILEKKRYLDAHSGAKVFETYSQKELTSIDQNIAFDLFELVRTKLQRASGLLIADYGHGLLGEQFANLLSEISNRVCVNVQANAGNRGFNFVSKYPYLSFATLAEHELRLEMRDDKSDLISLTKDLSTRFKNWDRICVTSGKLGLSLFDGKDIVSCPAFTTKVVDRVGAGDAVFAMTSILHLVDADPEVIALMGNLSGALAVSHLGNQKHLTRATVSKSLKSLLK